MFNSLQRLGKHKGHRRWGLLVALACAWCAGMTNGCAPPPDTIVISTVTGEPVDMQSISAILNNGNLTTEQKRDRLVNNLGVPADIADILLAS